MPTTHVFLIVGLFVLMDSVIIGAAIFMICQKFKALAAKYPVQPVRPGSVTRRFQSIALDSFNFGYSVHLTVDDAFMHLNPTRLVRFFGGTSLSIPWDAISITKRGRWNHTAKLGAVKLIAPAWCLDLAYPPDDSDNKPAI